VLEILEKPSTLSSLKFHNDGYLLGLYTVTGQNVTNASETMCKWSRYVTSGQTCGEGNGFILQFHLRKQKKKLVTVVRASEFDVAHCYCLWMCSWSVSTMHKNTDYYFSR